MAFWNPGQIISINEGARPNDGTGDNIRDAFLKVDNNFGNISAQLVQFNQDWTNANIEFNFQATFANITNSFTSNTTGTTSNFTGNTRSANIIANTGLYSSGITYLAGNTFVSGNIIPTAAGAYNLGTATRPFGNLYVQNTISTNQISQSTDAGILKIHANSAPGDIQDTGILGNVSSSYTNGGNVYAFFGYQYETDNFIYKITPIDTTSGNNIVVGGVFGNAQLGSLFLSNTTASNGSTNTGALIVAGGAGIAGNVSVGGNVNVINTNGNMYVNGSQVLTTSSSGIGQLYNGTSALITGNVVFPAATLSTSYLTGAIVVPNGGIGVFGNVVSQNGFVGSLYGLVQSPAQTQITSLGTLTGLSLTNGSTLNASGISATSVGTTTLTVTSTLTATGVPIVGLSNVGTATLFASGNAQVSNVNSSGNVWAGYYIGNGSLLSGIANNSTFQTLNANVGTLFLGNASTNANLGTYQNTTNANIGSQFNNFNTLTANVGSYYAFANANSATQSTSINTLNANVGTYQNTTNANIGTQFINFNTLTANVGLYQNTTNANIGSSFTRLNTLDANVGTFGGNVGVASYISKNSLSVGGTLTVTGSVLPSANVTYNLGSPTAWWSTVYGKAIQAQYADLAEIYTSDDAYEPGTVVVFGGNKEITITTRFADARVAGAISTDPAYLMNSTETGLPVALRGRIPVKVTGPVTKGDSLVTSGNAGYAVSVGTDTSFGQAVFAKSLETNTADGEKVITAVII